MFTQKIVSKSHLNKGHYTNSAEFPPESNTYRLWRHFFRLLFPFKRPLFSLKICSDMPSSNTQGTSWPDFRNWSRGLFKTPFCPINLFYVTCFVRIIIEKKRVVYNNYHEILFLMIPNTAHKETWIEREKQFNLGHNTDPVRFPPHALHALSIGHIGFTLLAPRTILIAMTNMNQIPLVFARCACEPFLVSFPYPNLFQAS